MNSEVSKDGCYSNFSSEIRMKAEGPRTYIIHVL